jgi:hypothetical protein
MPGSRQTRFRSSATDQIDTAIKNLRNGTVTGFMARDISHTYTGIRLIDGATVLLKVDVAGRKPRRKSIRIDFIEEDLREGRWRLWSKEEQDQLEQRLVPLDRETCAKLAKKLVFHAVRNPLERFHDRISDEEMEAFNRDTVDRVYTILRGLYNPFAREHFIDILHGPAGWDDPKVVPDLDVFHGGKPGGTPEG